MNRSMTHRENWIRAWRFQRPGWIPLDSSFPAPCWEFYGPEALEEIHESHPLVFPGYVRGSIWPDHFPVNPSRIAGRPYTDLWGCVWETRVTGMTGAVRVHPLADWSGFDAFRAPDPGTTDGMLPLDWNAIAREVGKARSSGQLAMVGLPHGHTFLRLEYLRGFEALLLDIADREPRLEHLLRLVEDFNASLVERYLRVEPDVIAIPEDLGSQTASLVSPADFRRYFKLPYRRLTRPVKERGILVHEHSDGYILDLVDDLVECGGDVLNLQDLVNGIDNIRRVVRGRMAIDLDLDRQEITVKGSPRDIDDHVRECVEKLGSAEGGLSLSWQPWPPTPVENVRAVLDSMERWATRWS